MPGRGAFSHLLLVKKVVDFYSTTHKQVAKSDGDEGDDEDAEENVSDSVVFHYSSV